MGSGGVVGDAIEHLGAVGFWELLPQSGEVEPGGDLAVFRRDAGDFVGHVNIGENLAGYPFQLVEVFHGVLAVHNIEGSNDSEILGVDELQSATAVAHDEQFAVVGEAPAFALKGVAADRFEGIRFEDISGVFLPSEHEHFTVEDGEALAKDGLGEGALAEDFPAGGFDFAERGFAVLTGAFKQAAAGQLQALGVGGGIVRAGGNNLIAQFFRGGFLAGSEREQGGGERGEPVHEVRGR